ncbi:MAG: hypothetical protein AAFV25_06570, partial [Bacteroidota bacterium]
INIQYKSLFEVNILHHYFLSGGASNKEYGQMNASEKAVQDRLYNLSDVVELIPDARTLKQMRGLKQVHRSTARGFRVMASVTEEDRPVVDLPEGQRWTFALCLKDPNFWNYTALRMRPSFDQSNPLRSDIQRALYFSNATSGLMAPHLSQPIAAFDNRVSYQMNDLCLFNGKTYEAVRNNPPGASPIAANSGWQEIDVQSYATHRDELRLRPAVFHYRFTQDNVWALFQLKNWKGDLIYEEHGQSSAENRSFPIRMTTSPPGWYKLEVSGRNYSETQDFYYHPEFRLRPVLGFVEMFHQQGLAADVALLDGDGKLREPSFDIRFKNRLTQWRYVDSKDQSVVSNINGIDQALPLTQTGFITQVRRNGKKLPNPDAAIVKTETDAIYSDVFIDSDQFPL